MRKAGSLGRPRKRSRVPPPTRVHKDRKKEASRLAITGLAETSFFGKDALVIQ